MNKKVYDLISNYKCYDKKEENDKSVMLEFIKNNEDVLTRENRIAHFTVSVWITNKDRNKVIMIHHNIYNSWAWVGGHADGDDDFLHVAKKETEEETGIKELKLLQDDIFGLNIVTVDNHIKRGQEVSSHLHLDVEYVFEADDTQELRIKEDENSGVMWVDIDKVCEYTTEEKMKPIYKRLNEKLRKLNT